LNLTLDQIQQLAKVDNPIDRDVLLKQKLGVSASIFASSAELLKIAPNK